MRAYSKLTIVKTLFYKLKNEYYVQRNMAIVKRYATSYHLALRLMLEPAAEALEYAY